MDLHTKIAAVLDVKPVGSRMTVQGWVKSKRKQKVATFLDVSDGSTPERLQIVVPHDLSTSIDVGASVKVEGTVRVFGKREQLELHAENVELLGPCKVEDGYPFAPRTTYVMPYIRQHLDFRPRTSIFSSIFRVRSRAANAFRNHLDSEGFFEVNAPILTSNDCEGAGEVFFVKPENQQLLRQMAKDGVTDDEAFFSSKAYLSVSGQMHLESAVRGLGHVYTFGPTFRAENSKSRLHLSEFYMLETEEILSSDSLETVLATTEKMLRSVTKNILDSCATDLEAISKVQRQQKDSDACSLEYEVEPLCVEKIEEIFLSSDPYTIMTYQDAFDILSNSKENFEVKPQHASGLGKEHELFLVKHNNNKPIFVVDWPAHLKAFYMKGLKDSSMVAAMDLLVPVVGELCGGSVREDDVNVLSARLKQLGLEDRLSWYLNMRKFGNVHTGGFGMGFERYLQTLLSIPNIKDVIPFPRWPHNCQM